MGRLNFIQNDTIDDHFVQLFESHESIKELLYSIEHQSKQTSLDLSQLFERLKSNNLHLNKLLDGISAYSREVTEEGGATKSDITRVLRALEDTQLYMKESACRLEKRQKDSLEQLTSFFEDAMNRQRKSGAYIDSSRLVSQHLDKEHSEHLEKRLHRVYELVGKSQEEQLGELKRLMVQSGAAIKKDVTDELVQRVEQVVASENASLRRDYENARATPFLQKIMKKIEEVETKMERPEKLVNGMAGEMADRMADRIADRMADKMADRMNEKMAARMDKMEKMAELLAESQSMLGLAAQDDPLASLAAQKEELARANEALEKRNLQLSQLSTKMEEDLGRLTSQYAQLRQNYSNLNDKYEAKLKLCEHVRAEFSALQQEAQQFENRMRNLDIRRHDPVPNLHAKKDVRLSVATPLLERKRVSSMPSKESRERSLQTNNSDLDE